MTLGRGPGQVECGAQAALLRAPGARRLSAQRAVRAARVRQFFRRVHKVCKVSEFLLFHWFF